MAKYNEIIIVTTPTASGGGPAASTQYRAPVGTFADLSTVAVPSLTPPPVPGEMRVVLDVDEIYIYDEVTDVWVDPSSVGVGYVTSVNGDAGPAVILAIDDLPDVDTTTATPVRGNALAWDGTNWTPSYEPFVISATRNRANTTNIWLRTTGNAPMNSAPTRVPFDAKIVAISATSRTAGTWDAEVYADAVVRAGGVPLDANKLTELKLTASNSAQIAVNVDIVAGTELGIFMRGVTINRPNVKLWLVRRN